jgi:hypothetical protein
MLCSCLILFACKKDSSDKNDSDNFDRTAMLSHIGSEVILEGYVELLSKTTDLKSAAEVFTTGPTTATLEATQAAYMDAYLAWQGVSPFEFGPAGETVLKTNLNIYPTNASKIEQNITNGKFQLNVLQNKDAKGFPAIDYLLYHEGPEQTVDSFSVASNAANRKQYLMALIDAILEKVAKVHNAWSASGDNYLATFVSLSGTDVGSSLGNLVNELNKHVEVDFRDGKFGIPVGVRSAGIAIPNNVEAYYSGESMALAKSNFETLKAIYYGLDKDNNDGIGLDDHLLGIDAADLHTSIDDRLKSITTHLNGINDPLSQQITNDPDPVNALYKEIQQLVVLFKVELPSRLGVLITYQDNDGD